MSGIQLRKYLQVMHRYGIFWTEQSTVMSVVLTVCSLGTRVLLAYILSGIPSIGVVGIWAAIPIGWVLADFVGIYYYFRHSGLGKHL